MATAAQLSAIVAACKTVYDDAVALAAPPVVSTPSPPVEVFPAWRRGLTKGVPILIPGTPKMSGISELQTQGALGGFGTIDGWNGLASDDTTFYSVCNGGHGFPYNGDYRVDLSADSPLWIVARPSSTVFTPTEYYPDGSFCSRHSYYGIAKQDRKIVFPGTNAAYGIYMTKADGTPGYSGGSNTLVYDLDVHTFSKPGDFPINPAFGNVGSVCIHPVTGEIYYTNNQNFAKFDGTVWTKLPRPAFATGATWYDQIWEFHPTMIDVKRNRYFCVHTRSANLPDAGKPHMASSGLDMKVMQTQLITGDLPAIVDYSALTHDLDNDVYVVATGPALYAINPDTLNSVKLCDTPVPANGWSSRVKWMKPLGGIAYVPSFGAGTFFLPTR
jgi:hypothetical protein